MMGGGGGGGEVVDVGEYQRCGVSNDQEFCVAGLVTIRSDSNA